MRCGSQWLWKLVNRVMPQVKKTNNEHAHLKDSQVCMMSLVAPPCGLLVKQHFLQIGL